MKAISNEEKIGELAEKSPINWISKEDKCTYRQGFVCGATKIAKWKDEQIAFALSFLKPRLSANEYAIVCDRLNFKE